MSPVRSIRTRLLVGTGLGVAIAFLVAGLIVHVLARASLYAQLDSSITAEARSLATLVEQEGDELDTDLTPSTLAGAPGRYFELFAEDGQVLTRSASLGTAELEPTGVGEPGIRIADATLPGGAIGRQATLRFHPRMEAFDRGEPMVATLVVARRTDEAAATIARLDTVLAVTGAIAIVVCVVILWFATRYGLAPVGELARRIADIDPADPDARLAADGVPGELAPIVGRLDDLLARLAAVVARERDLTAEVAHELRTPLAGLRSTIELALSRDREPERYRSSLRDCLVIIGQTHRMIEALLALARLDAGTATATRVSVPLAAFVDDALALVEARAGERRLTVVRAAGDATALTDPDRLRVVIQNLVDNAVSHADDGGRIEVAITTDGERAVVRVANTGCRIPAAAAAHVFERFWRGDAARTAGEHTGLGLALCKKLVDLVGGTIAVDAEVGGEFAVTVGLPAVTPGAAVAARSG